MALSNPEPWPCQTRGLPKQPEQHWPRSLIDETDLRPGDIYYCHRLHTKLVAPNPGLTDKVGLAWTGILYTEKGRALWPFIRLL